ncbi:hypothetical protein E1B28_006811 [Marasmius oreades]|uniref:Alpha/beta hydrolase fold-3 domain-containing protein n=1 Tax=Marasmius oreades TaxID=181124 RepID=A0A9P7UWY3_9AGAR|nr:uncharacterized protein E1B28_006811 [Marasmius oreades]KAG7096138.1 hypothetical protein E1B28_006811 [Marasmius oreades]
MVRLLSFVGFLPSPCVIFSYNSDTKSESTGGGFVMGSASPSFPPTLTTTQGLLQHTSFTHIFASEYRLSSGPPLPPKNPFPACLLDVLAGYFYLVNTLKYLPENVIVAGDSAGGVLAYQLVRYCVTYRGRGGEGKAKAKAKGTTPFPLPHGLLLLSPSVDCLLRPLPGTSMITNRRSDYIAPWFDKRYAVSALMGKGLVEADLDHSWFSPGSMSDRDQEEKEMTGVIFRQFPKTMIVTGEAEMSRDCNRVLKERMEMGGQAQGGGKVVYVEVEDAPHDILTSTLWEPERTIALQRIGSWVGEF